MTVMMAVPGFRNVEELLEDTDRACNPPIEEEDDNSTMWSELRNQHDPDFQVYSRWKDGRKMIKYTITVDFSFEQGINAFLRLDNDRAKWDQTCSHCKLERDYVAEGMHPSNVIVDHISTVGFILPVPARWFIKLPPDLKLRLTVIRVPDRKNVYFYILTSWDMELQQRNMKHKVRKYGEIHMTADGRFCITTVEKSGRWMPDWAVARVIRNKAKLAVTNKIDQYRSFCSARKIDRIDSAE